jgi:hypothetical protein
VGVLAALKVSPGAHGVFIFAVGLFGSQQSTSSDERPGRYCMAAAAPYSDT